MGAQVKQIDGDNLLYRVFLRILEEGGETSSKLVDHLVRSTSVWFPPALFSEMPVLLPWVVRDPKCRPHRQGQRITPDQWGAPNADGFLRDDNSLIKNIPRSLRVVGDRRSLFARGRLASGFVAAHVWREVRLEQLASRDPRLNSFIPNLVWLPRQIAKLSDHEGGVIQSALKQLSLDIYRDIPVAPGLKRQVDEIWDLLPPPRRPRVTGTHELNFFQPTDRFIRTRRGAISQATALLEAALRGAARLPKGRLPSRYVAGLPGISAGKLSEVLETVRALSPPAD